MPDDVRPIGGELEIALADLEEALLDEPPNGGDYTVTSGRTAIAAILAAADADGRSGAVAVPAYVCESVLQPVLEAGREPVLYPIGRDLSLDIPALETLVRRERPSIVLVVDYFGFPPGAEATALLRTFGDMCWVVRDRVQTVVAGCPDSEPFAAFSFTSFRKTLPVPDGGVVRPQVQAPLPLLAAEMTPDTRLRLLGKLLRHEVLAGGPGASERAYLELFAAADELLRTATPLARMSRLSARLHARMETDSIVARRQENFRILATAFADAVSVPGEPLFAELPEGVCPLVFPLRVPGGRRDALRARLAERRIYCPVHWPLPSAVDSRAFPDAARLSREILGLPIDQRYGRADMERLLHEFESAWQALANSG